MPKDLQLAMEHHQSGRLEKAKKLYEHVLEKSPEHPDALHLLGLVAHQYGQHTQAISLIEKAISINPEFAAFHNNCGLAYSELRNYDQAIECFKRAQTLDPDFMEPHNNMGLVLQTQGRFQEAFSCFQHAIVLKPGEATIYENMGGACKAQGRLDEAEACYKQALKLNPNLVNVYVKLGDVLKERGNLEEAVTYIDRVLSLQPRYMPALWLRCMMELRVIYDDEQHLKSSRANYTGALERLYKLVELDNQTKIHEAAYAIGNSKPFLLAYQGEDDRYLQGLYGDLVARIQAAKYPQWAQPVNMPPVKSKDKIRVGIVSGFFYLHSNWKIPIKGWVENIDRSQFELYGYSTRTILDSVSGDARRAFDTFSEYIPFEDMCQKIKDDGLHILIYPEVGMDPTTLQLASLRLAPLQCTSWGHPDTSGLPTIDYYLSSDLMELPDADKYYTEKLVRLPNISVHYLPVDFTPAKADRQHFGLRDDAVLYLCSQSLYKYLPRFDEVFSRIALEVENSQFVFIEYAKSRDVTDKFRRRLGRAFSNNGMDAEDYIVFVPRMDNEHYQSLNKISDIFLDSIGWSGCNSTLEAIAHNLPLLTLPGEFMRSRHSFAILSMMQLKELIAEDLDHYVRLAVQLGLDMEYRGKISRRVAENKHLVYEDMECVTALESFIRNAVRRESTLT